jgi:hypothetical protein
MKNRTKSRSFHSTQPRGFALIVTLSLMILLTVIAVGLLSLSSISLRSSSQSNAMATAQANARLALMLAIGDLQTAAGPDKRVTARANILGVNTRKPQIAGIWDSWEITPDSAPGDFDRSARDGKFRQWLTSGSPTDVRDINFVTRDPLSTNSSGGKSPLAVNLWDKGTLGDPLPPATATTPSGLVTVNKLPIVSPPGAVAWAVMDDGVKARIDTTYADTEVAEGQKTAQLGSGERPGTEFLPGLSGLSRAMFEKSAPESVNLAKGFTRQNFSLAAGKIGGNTIPSALKPLAHDVTTHSSGLLTDTARGGLRQDFHLLTNSALHPDYRGRGIYASRSVMPSSGGPSDPTWDSIRDFATLYKDTTNLTKIGGIPMLKTKVPANWEASTKKGASPAVLNREPPPGAVLVPTIAKVQMLFSLIGRDLYANLPENIQRPLTEAEKVNMHGPQDAWFKPTKYNYDLHMLYTPIVTLHNPYNVALEFSTMRLEFVGIPFSMQVFRNGIPLSKGLVPFETMTGDNSGGAQSKVFGMNLRTKVNGKIGGSTFRMLPGEVILFSPYIDPNTTYAADLKNRTFWDIYLASSLTNSISAIPGWRGFGIGYDCDWLAGNQPVISGEAAKQPPYGIWNGCYGLAWDDKIHVEFAPIGIPVNKNKFIVQLSATVGGKANKKITAMEIDYESADGFQKFLTDNGSPKTLRFPKADANPNFVLGHELRNRSGEKISNLDKPKAFALLTAQAKNTSSGIDNTNKSGRFAAKPWAFTHGSIGASSQKMVTEHSANHSHELDLLVLDGNDAQELVTVDPQDRSRFISGSTATDNSTKFGNLYDVPLAPVQTLASLNGANPGGSSGYLPRFAQPIGNSWAHPLISPDKVSEAGPSGYNYLDHSFLLNLALYDGFFFSGLADQTGNFGSGKTSTKIADDYAAGTALDDPRLEFRAPDGRKPSDFASDLAGPDAYKKVAAWQMMNGAFNINSTSVPAWKAMLASIHDSKAIANQRANAADIKTAVTNLKPTAADKARISRMRLPNSSSAADGADVKDAYWLGPREYSDAELQTLAEKIVEQVRARGPFLSMAEFVNRRLGPASDEKAQRGALQQAIDASDLNSSLAAGADAGYEVTSGKVANFKYKNPKAAEGPSYQGAPGFLTQADLLNVLGNSATARSDTFTIRGFGEARDPSGKLIASAVCEAVVQRVPEWVDPADTADTAVAALTSPANRNFGRRFIVTSMRWLNSNEI